MVLFLFIVATKIIKRFLDSTFGLARNDNKGAWNDNDMKKLLHINPVLRTSTSTGRIIQEIGAVAMKEGWDNYIAYSKGRDGVKESQSKLVP